VRPFEPDDLPDISAPAIAKAESVLAPARKSP